MADTNFRQPLEVINAALANYLVAGGKVTSKSTDSQTKSGNAALGATKAVIDALVSAIVVIRGTAELEALALDVASGAFGADAKFIGSTVKSLDDRLELLAGADKALDDAVKAFKTMLDGQSANAAAAKAALKPADKSAGGSDKPKS